MKRQGIGKLIPWLIVLDVLLLTAFLVLRISHTRIGDDTVDYPKPSQQVIPVPSLEPFELGDEPEQLLIDISDVDRPAETAVPLGDREQEMTLIAGSFALRGGPGFSLYIDQSQFQLIENEGRCYFCPINGANDLYLEIAFFNGVSADVIAPSVFLDYGVIIQKNDVTDSTLNGMATKLVTAKTMENYLEAYVLDVDGGCLTLVLCTPGTASFSSQSSLTASLNSISLQE